LHYNPQRQDITLLKLGNAAPLSLACLLKVTTPKTSEAMNHIRATAHTVTILKTAFTSISSFFALPMLAVDSLFFNAFSVTRLYSINLINVV
jgi:hypothetical protein